MVVATVGFVVALVEAVVLVAVESVLVVSVLVVSVLVVVVVAVGELVDVGSHVVESAPVDSRANFAWGSHR